MIPFYSVIDTSLSKNGVFKSIVFCRKPGFQNNTDKKDGLSKKTGFVEGCDFPFT